MFVRSKTKSDMIQWLNSLNFPRVKSFLKFIKKVLKALLSIVMILGIFYFIYVSNKTQPKGHFDAKDMKEFYVQGYKDGANNMRQALIKANTDTTKESCQDK